jgi:hypothetical protein
MIIAWRRSSRQVRSRHGIGDALDAINFAAAAIEEAEYAVLDATLARMDAEALEISA